MYRLAIQSTKTAPEGVKLVEERHMILRLWNLVPICDLMFDDYNNTLTTTGLWSAFLAALGIVGGFATGKPLLMGLLPVVGFLLPSCIGAAITLRTGLKSYGGYKWFRREMQLRRSARWLSKKERRRLRRLRARLWRRIGELQAGQAATVSNTVGEQLKKRINTHRLQIEEIETFWRKLLDLEDKEREIQARQDVEIAEYELDTTEAEHVALREELRAILAVFQELQESSIYA